MLKNFTPLHLLLTLLLITIIGIIGVIITVKIITSDGMPSLYELENPTQKYATQIISVDGEVIDHFYQEKRVPLNYDQIPKDFVNALIATEDRKFWKHWGVHTGRIFNSLVKNIFAGRTKEGASTITMQLARNLYLNREVNITRKIREAVTAFQIEQTYTKQEIIELYANAVNFGRGAYGLRIAAMQYFDKKPLQLTTAECAFLVGLLKKPEYYNKRSNYDEALKRRNLVLNIMMEQNYINTTQYVKSMKEPISFMQLSLPQNEEILQRRLKNMGIAPHFVEAVRQQLSKDDNIKADFNFYEDGLTIYTTLDSRIQKALNNAVNDYMPKLQKDFIANYSWSRNKTVLDNLINKAIAKLPEYKEANQGKRQLLKATYSKDAEFIKKVKNDASTIQLGIVIIDQSTGAVVGMIGGSPKAMRENPDAKYSLNHAVQIKRQPGSSFKPFIYASALQKGETPESYIECGPYSYSLSTGEIWSPSGSCADETGKTSLTRALVGSINTVSARLITQVTNPNEVIALAQKSGITSALEAVPALSLGAGGDVSPIELVAAYSIFGNNGIFVKPYLYNRIEDKFGEIISERKSFSSYTDVLEKEIAGQMTYMMQQVVNYGTATRVRNYLKGIDAAGKTGTTNDAADAWFIGYTPQLVCGIWMGFDDRRVNFDCLGATGYGGRVAAPLWGAIMASIYDIPTLPYKQKKFSSFRDDNISDSSVAISTDTNNNANLPYSLTKTQIEYKSENINFEQLPNNEDTTSTEDEINRRTFIRSDEAMLINKRKRKNYRKDDDVILHSDLLKLNINYLSTSVWLS